MSTESVTDGGLGLTVGYLPGAYSAMPSQIDGPTCTYYDGADKSAYYL